MEAVHTLQVEETRARALRTRLDSLFQEGRGEAFRYNADYDLEFVRHPATYWFGRNSNHVLAEWLRELGVPVGGITMFSSWKVEAREAAAHGRRLFVPEPAVLVFCCFPGFPIQGRRR
jgi:hypothetical protein